MYRNLQLKVLATTNFNVCVFFLSVYCIDILTYEMLFTLLQYNKQSIYLPCKQ